MGRRGKGSSSNATLQKQLEAIRRKNAADYAKRFNEKAKDAEKQKRKLNNRLNELEELKQVLFDTESQSQIDKQLRNVRQELAKLNGQTSDTDSEEMDINDKNNNNYKDDERKDGNNNTYNDDESKGEDNPLYDVGNDNTRRSKKMKMDSDYDPNYDQRCQKLLNDAKEALEQRRKRGRKNDTLKKMIRDIAGHRNRDCVQGAIDILEKTKRSQKRSLISLSRMTL